MAPKMTAQRALMGRIKEMRCGYCRVPTAATIDHIHPRKKGGKSRLENLVLACPYCNTKKSTREYREFLDSGDWRLPHPQLPATMREMLREHFGIEHGPWSSEPGSGPEGELRVRTGSPHSQLSVKDGQAWALIRPGAKYQWTRVKIGPQDAPATLAASYDFLARHFTPKQPKPISGSYFAAGKARRR